MHYIFEKINLYRSDNSETFDLFFADLLEGFFRSQGNEEVKESLFT